MTVLIGFAILTFGGLRLVRHTDEGFGEADGTSYYVGWTVVHVNFVVLLMFYLDLFIASFDGWLAAATIVVTCPLMISGYKSYKTHVSHALAASFVLVAFSTSFLIAFTGLL